MLQNNLNFILNNINSASQKDDGTRYTIKLNQLCDDDTNSSKFGMLNMTITQLKIEYFEYTPKNSKCYSNIEIGIFISIEEAMLVKSKLPKGYDYKIVKFNN